MGPGTCSILSGTFKEIRVCINCIFQGGGGGLSITGAKPVEWRDDDTHFGGQVGVLTSVGAIPLPCHLPALIGKGSAALWIASLTAWSKCTPLFILYSSAEGEVPQALYPNLGPSSPSPCIKLPGLLPIPSSSWGKESFADRLSRN